MVFMVRAVGHGHDDRLEKVRLLLPAVPPSIFPSPSKPDLSTASWSTHSQSKQVKIQRPMSVHHSKPASQQPATQWQQHLQD